MAEVIGRSELISCGIHHQEQQHRSQFRPGGATRIRMVCRSADLKLKASGGDFFGRRIVGGGGGVEVGEHGRKRGRLTPVTAQLTSGIIGRSHKWWEKGIQPNMKEVTSAQDLVDSLANAGNKLVVLEFFSPGCGGCKALHPKICQLAEQNPEVQFLTLNHEDHKSLAYSLGVHVLPFFRFYRGAEGRLCSFSCTNATIKKFKDALAKHSTDRCSLGPLKGLEEKELVALAANKDLGFSYVPASSPMESDVVTISRSPSKTLVTGKLNDDPVPLPLPLPLVGKSYKNSEHKSLVNAER